MKKLFTSLFALAVFCFLATPSNGQIQMPSASPSSEVTQAVGLSKVTINYSRPSMKGRKIFAADGLVPYGKMWRTGANAATKFTFSDDVTVGGKELAAGAYAVLTIPNAEKWVVNFYPYESGSWGSYREKDPAASISAMAGKMDVSVETFMIDVNNIKPNSADIFLVWENTAVAIPMQVEVDKRVMASIDRTLSGPTPGDYYQAATYYHESGKDLKKALEYITKANDTDDPKFWQVRREALILADMGSKKEAIAAAKKSMELAEKAGNEDYIRMNKKSIAEWSK